MSVVQSSAAKAVLGKSVVFKGQIQSREDLIIEGGVEGTIEMIEHRLTIAADGDVRANVIAREIEVIGSIEGKAEAAEKVYIRKAAKVVGDIYSAGIVIEDGGYVKGNIDLSRHPMDSQTHPAVAGSYSDHSEAHPIHELSDMALARQETKSMKAV
jgi:cytoskeletal protein CcmA (bactofilin family)